MSDVCVISQCESCKSIRGLIPVERPEIHEDGLYHLLEFFIPEQVVRQTVGGILALLERISDEFPHLKWHRVARHGTLRAFTCVASDPSFPPVVDPAWGLPYGHCLIQIEDDGEDRRVSGVQFVLVERSRGATEDLCAEEGGISGPPPGLPDARPR